MSTSTSTEESLTLNIEIPDALLWLFDKARYKVAYGGRGGAKSESIARALVAIAMESPKLVLCAREVQDSIADSSKATVEAIISYYDLWGYFSRTNTEIRCINGSRFIFKGLRSVSVANIKSLYGVDICWVEEANAVSKKSLNLLLPTIRKPGSEIWFSYNPENEDDPVHEMFVIDEPPPDAIVVKVGWEHNPWLPDELRRQKDWMHKRDPDLAKHVWGGLTLKRTKEHIYNNWRKESFEAPDDVVFYFGADWGFSIDPSCLVRCWFEPGNRNKLYIDYEAWARGCPIEKLHQLFDPVPRSHDFPITADSSKPETIKYLKKKLEKRNADDTIMMNELGETQYWNRYQMRPSKKGPGSVIEGIEFLQALEIVVHPRCTHVIDELKKYKFKVDPHTDEILRVPVDKKNHTMDSLRYAVERVRRMSGLPGMPTVVQMG